MDFKINFYPEDVFFDKDGLKYSASFKNKGQKLQVVDNFEMHKPEYLL